jgi:hypothetical protein
MHHTVEIGNIHLIERHRSHNANIVYQAGHWPVFDNLLQSLAQGINIRKVYANGISHQPVVFRLCNIENKDPPAIVTQTSRDPEADIFCSARNDCAAFNCHRHAPKMDDEQAVAP